MKSVRHHEIVMHALRFMLLASVFSYLAFGQSYTINTFAGGGLPALPVNLPGTSVSLGDISAIAVDSAGNVFVASVSNRAVFRWDARTGIVTVAAGNGTPGSGGDGGPATNAQLNYPTSLAVDAGGGLYIGDIGNYTVRKVSTTGVINTVAGRVFPGSTGDSGLATSAYMNPTGLAVDSAGDLYISDDFHLTVHKVSNGLITIVAGNGTQGFSGDGGPATDAQFYFPEGLAVDASGNLYIADPGNHRIRKVSNGVITTIAGIGSEAGRGDGGPATSAQLVYPSGVAVDVAGNLYISDPIDPRIREVSNGVIMTVVGGGATLGDGGPATSAQLSNVYGIALNASGNLYIADSGNNRIREVSNGVITTLAGDGTCCFNGEGGPATGAALSTLYGVAADSAGNILISDLFIAAGAQSGLIHKVSNGVITTVAGGGTGVFGCENGPAAEAQLNPVGVAVDSAGNLFIADTFNECIREVSNGVITTIAGDESHGFGGDGGPATNAKMYNPAGVAVDSAGNVYIADTGNSRIRKVSKGVITTVVGTGTPGFSGDGGSATSAELDAPFGIAVDAEDNLYIADAGNDRIRKVSNGLITTVAGNGFRGFLGDNGPALNAGLYSPYGIAVDTAGNLYIADTLNSRVRKVQNGTITTIAGNGSIGFSGDNGPATAAGLNGAYGVAVEPSGKVFIADSNNNRIRVLTPSGSLIVTSVVNAASNLPGPIAPGEIVVLIGAGIGPAQLISAQVGSDGLYDAQLSGTAVQFNGISAPIIYTSATQVAAIVPYEVSGGSAQVMVTYQGQTSAPITTAVASSAPGLFTLDSTGRGQAAAVNPNGSINSASTPAPIGSIVSLYATGEGQTTPAGVDGKPGTAPLPRPNLPVGVTIGGLTVTGAQLQYEGGAPGQVAGLLQINVPIPQGVTLGAAVPIAIQIGTASSQADVSIAVSAP
jgi:uncharacterized protein (TIGR03437 family)